MILKIPTQAILLLLWALTHFDTNLSLGTFSSTLSSLPTKDTVNVQVAHFLPFEMKDDGSGRPYFLSGIQSCFPIGSSM